MNKQAHSVQTIMAVPVSPVRLSHMGPGCCIALILVRTFEQPLTGLTELDACPSEPLVQHSGSHSQFSLSVWSW